MTAKPKLANTQSEHTGGPLRATLLSIEPDGLLMVETLEGARHFAEILVTGHEPPRLTSGDSLLVIPPNGHMPAIVLGRVSRWQPDPPQAEVEAVVSLEAKECLRLKCGDASIDLRADGKVMIRGDDVLVRAKGTKRIRAGTVAIN